MNDDDFKDGDETEVPEEEYALPVYYISTTTDIVYEFLIFDGTEEALDAMIEDGRVIEFFDMKGQLAIKLNGKHIVGYHVVLEEPIDEDLDGVDENLEPRDPKDNIIHYDFINKKRIK